MSHHLDTPLARQNGRLYIDDLYVFPGERGTVFVMDVNSTVTGDDVQPGFHPEARYEFKVHFDDARHEDLTYRLAFDEAGPDGRQAMTVHTLTGAEARDDGATGTQVLAGMTGEPANQDSPAPPSSRSCSRSPMTIPGCAPAFARASGATRNWRRTPAAGGRSTASDTR